MEKHTYSEKVLDKIVGIFSNTQNKDFVTNDMYFIELSMNIKKHIDAYDVMINNVIKESNSEEYRVMHHLLGIYNKYTQYVNNETHIEQNIKIGKEIDSLLVNLVK